MNHINELAIILVIIVSGCGTLNIKDESIKSSKCLIRCAIECGAEGALKAGKCWIGEEKITKDEAINAAKCMAKCAIGCGLRLVEEMEEESNE
jgi:hypothetical protein